MSGGRVSGTSGTSGGRGGPTRGGLGGAFAVMFSGTFVSRILGFVRGGLLAVAIASAGNAATSFTVANTLPNTIYMLLAGGVINAVLVPQLVRSAKDPDGGQAFTNRLLTVSGAGLLVITVLLTLAAPLLVRIYGGGMRDDWLPIAYAFAFWCIPQVFFYGLYTLLGQVLNARSIFGPFMWAPVLNNVIAIAGLVVYIWQFGAMGKPQLTAAEFGTDRILLLALTTTAGVALQALVLVIPLWRSGFRYRPAWGLKGLGTISRMGGWTFASVLVGQLGVLAVSNVAAAASSRGEAEGFHYADNMTYQLAYTVFMLPQALVVTSLITAMFTRLSEHASTRDKAAVREGMSFTMRAVSVFTVLAAVVVVALSQPIARLVTFAGQSHEQDAQLALVISALAVGIPVLGLWSAVLRTYHAFQDSRTPFWYQIPMAVVVVAGALLGWWLLPPAYWVATACLALSLSYALGTVLGYLGLRRRLGSLDGSRVFSTHFRITLAAFPTLALGLLITRWWQPGSLMVSLLQVIVISVVMVALYVLVCHQLGVREMTYLTSRFQGIARRVAGPLGARLRTMAPARLLRPRADGATGDAGVYEDAVTAGMLLADRFRVHAPMDSGLPGVRAWSGTDTILEHRVVVLSISGPHRTDILDGARRAALVIDPRLPRVLRVGEFEGTGYVVQERFNGTPLPTLLAHDALEESTARAIAGEVASVLEVGRRRGVRHLGLTPDLVAITADGTVRVAGLGFAGAALGVDLTGADADMADADAVLSLLRAMAPEAADAVAQAHTLRTPANVVVALTPWGAIPPLAQLHRPADTMHDGAASLPASGTSSGTDSAAVPGARHENSGARTSGATSGDGDATGYPELTDEELTASTGAAGEREVLAAVEQELIETTGMVGGSWQPAVGDLAGIPSFEEILAGPDSAPAPEGRAARDLAGPVAAHAATAAATAESASEAAAEVDESASEAAAEVDGTAREAAGAATGADGDRTASETAQTSAADADADADAETLPSLRGAAVTGVLPSAGAPVAESTVTPTRTGAPAAEPTHTGASADAAPAPHPIRAFLQRLDQVIPSERLSVGEAAEESRSAVVPPDPTDWAVREPDAFTLAPAAVTAFPARQSDPVDDAADTVLGARHVGEAQLAALPAWWEGLREIWDQAAQRRRALAAERTAVREQEQAAKREADAAAAAVAAEEAELAAAARAEAEAEAAAAHAAAEAEELRRAAAAPDPGATASWNTGESVVFAPAQEPAAPPAPRPAPPVRVPTPPAAVAGSRQGASPAASGQDRAARDAAGYEVPERRTRTWGTINATPIVLLLVLAGVVYVFYLAINSLLSPLRGGSDEPTTPPAPSPTATAWAPQDLHEPVLADDLMALDGAAPEAPGPGPADLPVL